MSHDGLESEARELCFMLDNGYGQEAADRLRADIQQLHPADAKQLVDTVYYSERPGQGADLSITPVQRRDDVFDWWGGGHHRDRGRDRQPTLFEIKVKTPAYSHHQRLSICEDVGLIDFRRRTITPLNGRPYYCR